MKTWKMLALSSSVVILMGSLFNWTADAAPPALPPHLLTLASDALQEKLKGNTDRYLELLKSNPAYENLKLVKVNTLIFDSASPVVAVTLPDGKVTNFERRAVRSITEGVDSWVGYVPSKWKKAHGALSDEMDVDPLYYLSLVREGGKVIGDVIVDGQQYRLDQFGKDQQVLFKVNESKLPPEAKPISEVGDESAKNSSPKTASSTIRVLMVSTSDARESVPNYRANMAQALQNANEYMVNSRVPVIYELAGYFDAEYSDEGVTSQLGDLKSLDRPLGAAVGIERDKLRADLVTMYSMTKQYCGMAYVDASKSTGFSVIACLSSMAHELGHNLGATHNWEEGQAEGNPPYKYGFRHAEGIRFRTQLSYDCPSGGTCPKIPFHSNPRLTYEGVKLGTEAHHDVARRFDERRQIVEDFYPPMP